MAGHKHGHATDLGTKEVYKKPAGRHVTKLHKKPAGRVISKKPAQDAVNCEPAAPKTKKRAAEVVAVKKKPAAIAHKELPVGANNKELSVEEPPVKKPSVDESPIKDPPVEEPPVSTDDELPASAGEPMELDEGGAISWVALAAASAVKDARVARRSCSTLREPAV